MAHRATRRERCCANIVNPNDSLLCEDLLVWMNTWIRSKPVYLLKLTYVVDCLQFRGNGGKMKGHFSDLTVPLIFIYAVMGCPETSPEYQSSPFSSFLFLRAFKPQLLWPGDKLDSSCDASADAESELATFAAAQDHLWRAGVWLGQWSAHEPQAPVIDFIWDRRRGYESRS